MITSQLVVAKRAVVDLLKMRQDATPALTDVRVDYAYNPKLAEQQYLWGGAARLVVADRYADAGGGRELTISLELFADVRAAGEELEAADARCAEIADGVEAILSADPQLGGAVSGLIFKSIAAGEIEYGFYTDTAAQSSLGLDVQLLMHVRRP